MSDALLFRIADRVINRPLLILPEKLAIVTEVLAGRIGIDGVRAEFAPSLPDGAALAGTSLMKPVASRFVGDAYETDENGRPVARLPYKRTENGVAVITITGSLVNRGAWVGASSGLTSYEGIAHQVESAARDPKVKSIVLDIESPGGEAVGAMETAALVRKAGEAKPVYAVVNGMAASAAYALASAAKAIITTESGMSGSIGVVLLHADYSRAIDRAGITPTLIHAGAHKVDGNPYSPLTGPVKADLQAEVDKFYQQFLNTVAKGRGERLNAKAARATEARTFIGRDAKAAGLVDDIGAFADLVGTLSKSGSSRSKGTMRMNMHSDEDLARARAEGEKIGAESGRKAGFDEGKAAGVAEGHAAGLAEGQKLGATAERARISAIVGHEEAKGREATARHIAMTTDMSVEAAIGVLAGVPKAIAGVSSIGARAQETVTAGLGVDTGVKAEGNHGWDDIVAKMNKSARR